MPKLSDLFKKIRETADFKRARANAASDYKLLADLVSLRREKGLTQADVASYLDITQQAVSKFESHDSDPKLSTIRLYADAVGALVGHTVASDEGQLAAGNQWVVRAVFQPIAGPITSPAFARSNDATYALTMARRVDFALSA